MSRMPGVYPDGYLQGTSQVYVLPLHSNLEGAASQLVPPHITTKCELNMGTVC